MIAGEPFDCTWTKSMTRKSGASNVDEMIPLTNDRKAKEKEKYAEIAIQRTKQLPIIYYYKLQGRC